MGTASQRPRYVGELYQAGTRWLREGKLGPYLINDGLDTTGVHVGKVDPMCPGCASEIPHSRRYHRVSIIHERRRAVCAPGKEHLVPQS